MFSKAFDVDEGEILLDVNPERLVRFGYGAAKVMGNKVAVSCDGGLETRMIKNAVIAGILAGDANALDFGEQPFSITRCGIRFYGLQGGIHVCENGKKLLVSDSKGMCPDTEFMHTFEKKCNETCMERSGDSKELISLHSYKLFYIRELLNNCRNEHMNFNLLLWVDNSTVKNLLVSVLQDIGCKYTLYKGIQRNGFEDFSTVIKNEKYDFGVIIRGEKAVFFDNEGRLIGEELFCCICAMMVFACEPEQFFLAPPDAPSVIEHIAKSMGGRIIRAVNKVECTMTQFILNHDPVGGIVKLMDYLKSEKISFSEIVNMIPEIHITKNKVVCGEKEKNRFFKTVAGMSGGIEHKKTIKIYEENGWALLTAVNKGVSIVCEGTSVEMAEELMNKYTDMLLKNIK